MKYGYILIKQASIWIIYDKIDKYGLPRFICGSCATHKHGKLIRNAHMISDRSDLCIEVYKHNICVARFRRLECAWLLEEREITRGI